MFKKFKKKHIIYASLLIGIFSLFMFCTIAYSAINGTVKISGNAYARVEADARITDFRLASSNNATSSYEEFGKNHIATEIDLVDSSSSITYYVEVTNYGSTDVGVYSISGLPSGVNYSIKDYNLKDKICDENNVCHGFVKKTLELTLTTASTYSGSVLLTFDIRPFLNISYVGFSNQYLSEFIAGDSVSVDLSSDNKELVYAVGQDDFDYTYYSKILRFSGVWCSIEVGVLSEKDFSYTGNVQTYKVKADGVYKVELWGASGGNGLANGEIMDGVPGYGAYTSGFIKLNKDQEIYVYVGGRGNDGVVEGNAVGGYNGGGSGAWDLKDDESGGAGGGATDVRLVSGNWNDFSSLKSRIMVAAGGGGYVWRNQAFESAGGGLTTNCYNKRLYFWDSSGEWEYVTCKTPDTTQTFGYMFGIGKNGTGEGLHNDGSPGAGGGYYGGNVSYQTSGFDIAVGGSSFISWHDGCDAILENSTSSNIVHSNQSIHYSNSCFSNTTMIDGMGYKWTDKRSDTVVGMPNFDGNGTMTGNVGNGYAKITPVAAGNYNLMKFKYYNNDYSYMAYVLDNSDYSITFNEAYADVIVKYKDGSIYSNFSYDSINKRLNVYDISGDLEISLIKSFDVVVNFESGGDQCIHYDFDFSDVSDEHFPITVDFYHKLTTENEYIFIQSHEIYEEDLDSYWYFDCDTAAYESYDVKISFKGNNGYEKVIYDTAGTECFVAGTKVLTENGYVNIEDIQVGDYVYALDLNNNERVLKKVEKKFEGQSNETFVITVNGKDIVATPKHKFYVIDKGWIRAAELEVGDVLNSFNNGILDITEIKHIKHNNPVNVYNLTVEDLHNYFVSSDQLLVHNIASSADPF